MQGAVINSAPYFGRRSISLQSTESRAVRDHDPLERDVSINLSCAKTSSEDGATKIWTYFWSTLDQLRTVLVEF